MATKTISNATSYAGGYTLDGAYQTISITTSGYVGGTGITGGTLSAYTILNDGSIVAVKYGVWLKGGGSVTNAASASITAGVCGVYVANAAGSVDNSGTINAGIGLTDGGSVTNTESGLITGVYDGVSISGDAGAVDNYGSIVGSGSLAFGVVLFGGSVTNAASASITGTDGGVLVEQAAGTVVNSGSISGGVILDDGGSVTNAASASITGGNDGVYVGFHGAGTVVNDGTIAGASAFGVALYDDGSVTNAASGSITGGFDGVVIDGLGTVVNTESGLITGVYDGVDIDGLGTVVNYGSIVGSGSLAFGVVLFGGSVTNAASASITGTDGGVLVEQAAGTVVNSGSISGGVALADGGSVTNAASASITAYNAGVYVGFHGAGTVVNDGTIAGASAFGVALYDDGSVTNAASGSITGGFDGVVIDGLGTVVNSGSIGGGTRPGGRAGVLLADGGSVTNTASGSITDRYVGVYFTDYVAGTVINYGTISGQDYSVIFTAAYSVLEVEAGSTLVGEAVATYHYSREPFGVLEFGAGGGAGTVSGLGSGTLSGSTSGTLEYFGVYEIASGATWTVTGSNSFQGVVDGVLIDAGTLSIFPGLSGTGTIEVSGGTLDLHGSISAANLGFTGTSGLIDLTQLGVYTGIDIDNFGAGDTIVLLSRTYASGDTATYSGGAIELLNSDSAVLAQFSATEGAHVYGLTVVDDAGKAAIETITCFMPGTRIMTPDGEVPIEELGRGSMVTTMDGNSVPVRWLGRQSVSTRFGDPLRVLPIRIKAGAIAENVPARDLLCSPDHAFLIDDMLIQAHALVNGVTIVRERNVPEIFTLYHIECDGHELILAEGFAAETFVDNVDRLGFDNWDEHQTLYPEGKPISEMPWPRVQSVRQVPLAVREGLAQRAGVLAAA